MLYMFSAHRLHKRTSPEERSGFTLVELLLAMGIMGIIVAITVTAINPAKQMGDARNTQRKFDVNTILNGLGQYSIDNGGRFHPQTIDGDDLIEACKVSATPKKLCTAEVVHGTGPNECGDPTASCVWSLHLRGRYIADIPNDPLDDETSTEQHRVDYEVSSSAPGRLRVDSPLSENDAAIGAMR